MDGSETIYSKKICRQPRGSTDDYTRDATEELTKNYFGKYETGKKIVYMFLNMYTHIYAYTWFKMFV